MMLNKVVRLVKNNRTFSRCLSISSEPYVQGQSPPGQSNIREYFYYIDSFGQLFLDDTRFKNFTSCYKDPKFLNFFFSRVRKNTYDDRPYFKTFPYVSLCGRERNFIRCDDLPFVLTRFSDKDDTFELCHIPSSLVSIRFQPEKIYVKPDTGRIYHPISEKFHTGIALIKDSIAEQLSSHLIYNGSEINIEALPVALKWKGKTYELQKNENIENLVFEHSDFKI